MEWDWIKYRIVNECTYKKIALKRRLLGKETTIKSIKRYSGRRVLENSETNIAISDMIQSGQPFMVCRFGETELNTIISFLQVKHFPYKDRRDEAIHRLCKNAGFFPENLDKGQRFVDLMLQACRQIDLCGIWNLMMEDYILDKYAKEAQLTLLGNLEPWVRDAQGVKPWTSTLKGRKILVIHPFAKTIQQQYQNCRTKIFERKFNAEDILPDFQLNVIKAVQTINFNEECSQYKDWFEALDSMVKKCEQIDFDVAIIGCGAYGFPLAAAIKRMGKGAVHLGGATQLLFGIMGKRWESEGYKEFFDQIRNEYWTRPAIEERPRKAKEIEDGCYW